MCLLLHSAHMHPWLEHNDVHLSPPSTENEWMRELGLGFTNPVGTGGVLDMCLCFGCGGIGGVGGEWVGGLDQGRERWGGVMSVCGVSLDSPCIWQVQVSVYCAWRIPAHMRCTPCSILLPLMDI